MSDLIRQAAWFMKEKIDGISGFGFLGEISLLKQNDIAVGTVLFILTFAIFLFIKKRSEGKHMKTTELSKSSINGTEDTYTDKDRNSIQLKDLSNRVEGREVYCWGSLPMPNLNAKNGSLGARHFDGRHLYNFSDSDLQANVDKNDYIINPSMELKQISCGDKRLLFLTEGGYVYEGGSLNKAHIDAPDMVDPKGSDSIRTRSKDKDDPKSPARNDSSYNHSRCSSRSRPALVYGFLHSEVIGGEETGFGEKVESLNCKYGMKSLPDKNIICFVGCGPQHSSAISSSGHVFTWGEGSYGRLGHGSERDEYSPRKVISLIRCKVVSVACGHTHTLALSHSGAVYSWGEASDGRLGHGSGLKSPFLCEPMRITTFPNSKPKRTKNTMAKTVTFHRRIIDIACGSRHSVAVDSSGRVMCWGRNSRGQCSVSKAGRISFNTQEKAGRISKADEGKVLRSNVSQQDGDPTFIQFQSNRFDSRKVVTKVLIPVVVTDMEGMNVKSVSCGKDFTVALSESGKIFTWGWGPYGELGRENLKFCTTPGEVKVSSPSLATNDDVCAERHLSFRAVSCGTYHVCAIATNGETYCWGRNHNGELGIKNDVTSLDGVICCTPSLVGIAGITTLVSVACGDGFTFLVNETDGGRPSKDSDRMERKRRTVYEAERESEMSKTDTKRQFEKERNLQKTLDEWRSKILPDWRNKCCSKGTKALWRKGIPSQVRYLVWTLALGNDLKITPDLYMELREKKNNAYKLAFSSPKRRKKDGGEKHVKELIHSDLPRIFPTLNCFSINGPLHHIVRNVLETYVHFRPDVGYVQGMSYIAANLCLQTMDEYLAFQSLANLIHKEHMYAFCKLDKREIYAYYEVFNIAMRENKICKKVAEHLDLLNIHPHLYLFNWMQTLFLKVLPMDIANRIWDCFLLEGTSYILRASLAIIQLFSSKLLKGNFEECIRLLSCSPGEEPSWARIVHEAALFKTIEGVSLSSTVKKELNILLPFNSKLPA